jgi:hypothetical protein
MISISFFAVLAACGISEDKVVDEAEQVLAEKMEQEPQEPNTNYQGLRIYLPEPSAFEKVDDNQYRMEHDDQVYALFLDKEQSEVTDNQPAEEQPMLAEVRQGEEGFLLIAPFEKDTYEVKVGFEGITMTTVLNRNEITDQSRLMFDIVQSVEANNLISER